MFQHDNPWPVAPIQCPECGQWTSQYGLMDAIIDGQSVPICNTCTAEVEAELCPA